MKHRLIHIIFRHQGAGDLLLVWMFVLGLVGIIVYFGAFGS